MAKQTSSFSVSFIVEQHTGALVGKLFSSVWLQSPFVQNEWNKAVDEWKKLLPTVFMDKKDFFIEVCYVQISFFTSVFVLLSQNF